MPVSVANDSPTKKSLLPCIKKVSGPLVVKERRACFISYKEGDRHHPQSRFQKDHLRINR